MKKKIKIAFPETFKDIEKRKKEGAKKPSNSVKTR
jgi:hypothetical protein